LTSKSALEGERKQVTVLFCDIVDSSRLAQRLEPEAMHEVRIQQSAEALPELARSYLSYARLLTAAGDTHQARAHLTQAIDMFRRMGMERDLGRAEQVLRELA
jgi:hypothetical protein